ncbi:MAG: hypothetical protein ACRD28_12195, partial [Acidobacteriaceae bacterium]
SNGVPALGRVVFSLAIAGLGIETLVCARFSTHALGPAYDVIPILPWLPPIPWLAYVFGAILLASSAGIHFKRTATAAAMVLGSLLFLCAVVLDAPKYAASIGDMGLRTVVFESLALVSLACLSPTWGRKPRVLALFSRTLFALCLIVFGIDHFLAIKFIASLIPGWIPLHVFWVVFFGTALIAAGFSIAINFLERWATAGIGLMFGIWVVTLHIPRVLGLYGIPGAPHDPDEWSSLFIAVALWGGSWILARNRARQS